MNHLRRSAPLLATVLLLAACGSNPASAYSFDTAVQSIDAATQYRVEGTLTVDGKIQLRSDCDIDTTASAMRCDMELEGETAEVLADLSSGAMYVSTDMLADSGAPVEVPAGIRWLAVPADAENSTPLDIPTGLNDPLAAIGDLAGATVSDAQEVVHAGETLRGFKVDMNIDAAAQLLPPVDGFTTELPALEAVTATFYVNEASQLRGFRVALTEDISEGLYEAWITETLVTPVVLPKPEEVMDLEALLRLMLGGALNDALDGTQDATEGMIDGIIDGLEGSAQQVAATAAESIARETNARGGFSNNGTPTVDDLVQTAAEFAAAFPEWTVSTEDEIRLLRCAQITRVFGAERVVASVALPDGAPAAIAAPTQCRV